MGHGGGGGASRMPGQGSASVGDQHGAANTTSVRSAPCGAGPGEPPDEDTNRQAHLLITLDHAPSRFARRDIPRQKVHHGAKLRGATRCTDKRLGCARGGESHEEIASRSSVTRARQEQQERPPEPTSASGVGGCGARTAQLGNRARVPTAGSCP